MIVTASLDTLLEYLSAAELRWQSEF
jgi:hypothetical protein